MRDLPLVAMAGMAFWLASSSSARAGSFAQACSLAVREDKAVLVEFFAVW